MPQRSLDSAIAYDLLLINDMMSGSVRVQCCSLRGAWYLLKVDVGRLMGSMRLLRTNAEIDRLNKVIDQYELSVLVL
jgi:hypothetical protein